MAGPWERYRETESGPWAKYQSQPGAPAVAPEDVRDATGVPGGVAAKPAVQDTFGDMAIRTSAGVLGAPIDLVSKIMGTVGLPTSNAPFMGAHQIEGMLQGINGSRESREIAADAPNVTQDGGAPIGQRVYSSFMNTPDAQGRHLTRVYGAEGQGWYRLADRFGNPTDRVVVRGEDGKESLFNPPGIDMGDIAGMAGGVPDLIGAIMGGAASVPAYAAGPAVGIPTSAVLSAGGAQLVGEPVGRLFHENREAEPSITSDVLPRAGGEMASDALVGLIMGGGARVGNAIIGKVRAPFAESASEPMAREFRETADRLKQQGYDIAPLPSEGGAGGFIPRVEGLLEKLPGSAERMRQYRRGGDAAVSRFQRDLAGDGDASAAGRSVVSELETQRKNLVIDREEALRRANDGISANEQGLTARQGPAMSAEAAGQQGRAGLERARQEFRAEARRLYDIARDAPGGRDAIVDIAPVRAEVAKIRAALPPSATREMKRDTGILDGSGDPITRTVAQGGEPITEFTPQGLSRFLNGIDDIAPRMTIDQARQMRSIIDDAMDDKNLLPGVPERYLGQLRQSISRAIDGSVDAVGDPQLRDALGNANRFYAQNIDRFSRKGVSEVYRDPTSAGFIEDNRIVDRLLSGSGKPGVIRETRDLMGVGSQEWAAVRRNAVEQILDTGRDQTRYGRRVVNVDGLISRLNSLDDETVRELFGVQDAQQLRNLAADISNRTKYLDAAALSQEGTPNILQQLRAAAVADEQITRDYRESVVAPFLRGEDGARAKVNADELVPWLYRKAPPSEARAIMTRLDPAMRQEVERGVVADIIENAISKGRGDLSSVRRLVTGEADPASSQGIAEILGAGKDVASHQQADRINALLSPGHRQALRDLALITARRQERDATTQAIGGLAAGAAITGILSRPGRAAQTAIVARGLAQLITTPAFRKWVTNTRRLQLNPADQAQAVAVSPTLADVATGALGENEDIQTALEWLREGVSQIDEQGKRLVQPPRAAGSWEQYFSGGQPQ